VKDKKVAIIGFGPAGMFSALTFARAGVNVTVFERGEEVDKRVKTIEKFKYN
jgi:2-polyprenyl-6-methoxyphenol hydroxylase-like FAD-dependent oxidoreductase